MDRTVELANSARLGATGEWRVTYAYGLAHFGKSLFWYASEILFAFFLTEISQLPARSMGAVLSAGLVLSAIIDVAMGMALRRALTQARSAARLQFLGAGFSALTLVFLFMGAWTPEPMRYAYAMGAGMAFRLAYAVYDIPNNALLSLATHDERARTRVSSLRAVFSGLAALSIAVAITPLLSANGQLAVSLRYVILAAALGAVALLSSWWLCVAFGQDRDDAPLKAGALVPFPADAWLLIAIMFAICGFVPAFSKILPYFTAYVLRSPAWGSAIMVGLSLGGVVTQPVWTWMARRIDRPSLMLVASGVLIGFAAALFVADHPLWTTVCAFGIGAASGGLGMILWAGFGDAISRAPGSEALAYGALTAAAKLGLAAGGLAISHLLDVTDYRGEQSGQLADYMALTPLLGGVCCVILAMVWSLAQRGRQAKNAA